MADAAHNKGEIPARIEIPGVVRQLPGIGTLASGIENSETPPPLDLGWEGNHVLAALDASEYTMPTDNPMFSSLADLSVFLNTRAQTANRKFRHISLWTLIRTLVT